MKQAVDCSICILGLGRVGSALLNIILQEKQRILDNSGMSFQVNAVADSTSALTDSDGLSAQVLQNAIETRQQGQSLFACGGRDYAELLEDIIRPGTIIIDTTASDDTLVCLEKARTKHCGIVLANKKPMSTSWKISKPFYDYAPIRYESTVGAGLPVISTLEMLLDSADQITRIEGVLSGSLGFLCSRLGRGEKYSVAIQEAGKLGYTEPDPRDDLSGMDVMRKALIMARTAGWELDQEDLQVEPFYSVEMDSLSPIEFLKNVAGMDEEYQQRFTDASRRGEIVRYMAQINPHGGRIGLQALSEGSIFTALKGPANLIAIYTQRYHDLPLIISGPGAGLQVTAAGVLADVIRLKQSAVVS